MCYSRWYRRGFCENRRSLQQKRWSSAFFGHDVGSKGTTGVGLNFKQLSAKAAGKQKDSGIETADKKDDYSFTVGWEAGLKIDHEFKIGDFQCKAVGGLKGNAFPDELRELTDSDRKKENLYL